MSIQMYFDSYSTEVSYHDIRKMAKIVSYNYFCFQLVIPRYYIETISVRRVLYLTLKKIGQ